MYRLTPENRVVLLMHEVLGQYPGKIGHGLIRYGIAPIIAIIDRATAGQNLRELTGINADIPIVASLEEALAFAPDVLIPAISPAGGMLPAGWDEEIEKALQAGLSIANGLHIAMGKEPRFARLIQRPGQFLWDVRQEPSGLSTASGQARLVATRRVLFVGTDMNIGKMTAALEMDRQARSQGLRSKFLATGQTGIMIAGEGIPLDAVKLDYAPGAVERLILDSSENNDYLFVEGQGSLFHPASTATLALIRGSMPTHLILVHRVGQRTIKGLPWVGLPSLPEAIDLYERVSTMRGASPEETIAPKVAGIALNTAHLNDAEAQQAIDETAEQTGLPVTDAVRYGAQALLDAVR
ncbi:MAG: hypothetical protein JWL77_183 [Chthonomonadaceae bacterium]|nr:hypothetical protein [Chthonomonadaceae bacterium]